MKHKTVIYLLLYIIPYWAFSQSDSLSLKERRKNRPTYIELGLGFGTTKMRDFATSPLFYTGPSSRVTLGRLKFDSLRESSIQFNYHGGGLSTGNGDDDSQSSFHSFDIAYGQQYRIAKLSNSVWNVKLGGELNVVSNLRQNPELMNAAVGAEFVATIFGTAQIGRDVSRKIVKERKFLFMKYSLKPRKRYLSYTLKTGIANNNFRNGYSYIGEFALLNDDNAFKDYEWNAFSGFRIASSLDYTIYLESENAVRISYITDIYTAKGDFESLEVARYALKIALLFKTN